MDINALALFISALGLGIAISKLIDNKDNKDTMRSWVVCCVFNAMIFIYCVLAFIMR